MIIGQFINRHLERLSGSTTKVASISNHLSAHCEVKVFSKDLRPPLDSKIKHYRVGRFFFPKSWPNNYALYGGSYKNKILRSFQKYKVLAKTSFDILHCHNLSSLAIANVYHDLIRKPIVFDSHGIITVDNEIMFGVQKNLLQKCSRILVMSKGIGQYYAESVGIDPSKIFQVRDAVDMSSLEKNYTNQKRHAIRSKFNLAGKKVIMYIGNFGNLNPKYLIDIFVQINKKQKESENSIVNVVITDTPFNKIKGLINSYDPSFNFNKYWNENPTSNIQWLPSVEYKELFNYLRSADVLISPISKTQSTERGLVSKLYPYLASEIPTIATSLGSTRELITDGFNGFLIEHENVDAFSIAVHKLLKDREMCKSIGANARESVKDFTWENSAKKILGIYENVLEEI